MLNESEADSEEDQRKNPDIGISVGRIRDHLDYVKSMPVRLQSDAGVALGRSPTCYLELDPFGSGVARSIGPLTRWLVAADMLTESCPKPITPLHRQLNMSGDRGMMKRRLRRMFGVRKTDDILVQAYWYRSEYAPGKSQADTDAALVATALIERLNERVASTRGRKITSNDFQNVQVPVDAAEPRVGAEPISWFRKWLAWGVGLPRRQASQDDLVARASCAQGELGAGWAQLHTRLVVSQAPQKTGDTASAAVPMLSGHLTNVWSRDDSALRDFVAIAYRQLHEADATVPTIRLSLARGATKLSILKKLYQVFNLDSASLEAIDAGFRSIDLAADLDPVRKALTVNAVTLLFDGWDVASGPFECLNDFLSNTNWAEFLRVLAQPHLETLLASSDPPAATYQILVATSQPIAGLAPWIDSVELAEVWVAKPIGDAGLPASEQSTVRQEGDLSEAELLLARLVSLSKDGMRRSTLRRCHEDWLLLFGGNRSQSFDAALKSVATKFGPRLRWFADDEHPVQRLSMRELDLNRSPTVSLHVDDASSKDNEVLAFCNARAQLAYVESWIDGAMSSSNPSAQSAVGRLATMSWGHLHYLICTEALRQCTWHLRNHMGEDGSGAHQFLRLAATALVHGVASLDLRADAFVDFSAANDLFGPPLPADRGKRHRYLVSHIYRYLIENENWRLGRSLGRSDLRLDLLTLIVNPSSAPALFRWLAPGDSTAFLPSYPVTARGAGDERPVAPELVQNKELWAELVEAIGRAGADLDGELGARAIEWALSRLPHEGAPASVIAALPRPGRGGSYERLLTSATKLRIDWLQSRDTVESLTEAERLCLRGLGKIGVDTVRLSELLFGTTSDAIAKLYENRTGVRRAILEALLAAQRFIEENTAEVGSREEVVDFMFRWGEILATRADELNESPSEGAETGAASSKRQEVALSFAKSLAVYWTADRVRSGIVVLDGQGVRWPRASPRPMRYFVRVLLKLARLFSKERPLHGQPMYRLTTDLLEFAGSRIEVYTRHNYQFVRERDSMLTLEAIRLRAWTRVLLERSAAELSHARSAEERAQEALDARPGSLDLTRDLGVARKAAEHARKKFRTEFNHCRHLLERCWDLLAQAERRLISLGFRPGHLRRVLLERIKSAAALLKLSATQQDLLKTMAVSEIEELQRQVERHRQLAVHDLEMLTAISRDRPFYEHLVDRQRVKLKRALDALNHAV
ncbi:hypothetical protein SNE35_29665 [Paucibacter sp. R3-3]|uniref:Uncharacterized protein n=1 Tax=Roseateles agri TaxID=3098619 RepID=A0ABU5DQV1_9BURK|nr:hypothetical protein [Paucibacter sp. R3-3]MDY0748703.1 hypothetical protein [Paucibacter sp. R3-3]